MTEHFAMISVTINAVNQMMKVIKDIPDLKVKNYLDEGLQSIVQSEGKVTDKSIARMLNLLDKAIQDGAKAILLTCTVFTPYIEKLQSLLSVPILSADGAMLEEAAKANKKTAILCTFPASVESSSKMYHKATIHLGITPEADTFLLEDAAEAINSGDKEKHDKIIADKAIELSKDYDVIVLAQISMVGALSLLKEQSFTILTSPQSAVNALYDCMKTKG